MFEVTKKDQSSSSDGGSDEDQADAGRFTFDDSPVFVVLTTNLFVQLIALAVGFLGLTYSPPHKDGEGFGFLEVLCCLWLVFCFWPFLKGLFGKGKYGIPLSTICKSTGYGISFSTLVYKEPTITSYRKLAGSTNFVMPCKISKRPFFKIKKIQFKNIRILFF